VRSEEAVERRRHRRSEKIILARGKKRAKVLILFPCVVALGGQVGIASGSVLL
jgi:hypothetical protein